MRNLIIVIAFLYLTGCSRNERSIVEPRYTTLEFKTFSTDALQLKVLSNETLLTDSLFAPDGTKSVNVEYYDPAHRIQLVDAFSNRTWFDTVINYRSGFVNSITFYQPASEANFVLIGPPVNESLPPDGYGKVSIRYTHAALPDLLKVVVLNNTDGRAYVATDSFDLKKDEFSRYFLAYNASTRKVQLKFYSTDGKRKTMAYAEVANFSDIKTTDFNIYLFRKQGLGTGDSLRILGEKLY
ncbi:hypothetical protein A4H97_09540 [Niastella yeongjuensis]|uniref:DUF4397 domain-containing protein n=1 Tax=Niastella yeongjuensis TaxID=354355 RepID=A0A1V9EEX3_9BACT|nr:hypothetical protein [Niastella yeongjuensis]OQP44601.1 hypothetical protein A4H97_09540 [Niastella yeongjuensis]SEO81840.1 hypothetical protein SAMN05660816_03636 [Niastella yeongjuensis]